MKQILSGTLGVQLDPLSDNLGPLKQPVSLTLFFGLRLGGLTTLLQ